jgi:hypothetical protein
MAVVSWWAILVLGLAGCLRSTIAECDDGWSCPPGSRCAAEPTADVHCMPVTCGDGILDVGELCDGDLVGDAHCVDLGYDEGALQCDANCRHDASACRRFGFATVYTADERIGPFCAYDTPAGVVAHFEQASEIVRVDAAGATMLPAPTGVISSIACAEDQLAVLASSELYAYAGGAWSAMPPNADDISWTALTVESGSTLVALATNTTGDQTVVWSRSPTGWEVSSAIAGVYDRIDVHAGYGFAGYTDFPNLQTRGPTGWVPAPPAPANTQFLWATDAVQQLVATFTAVYRRGVLPTPTLWSLLPAISPGPIVGRTIEDLFVLGTDFRLAHLDGRIWSTASGSFDDAWLSADGSFYASRGSQLVRAQSLWFVLVRAATQVAITSGPSPVAVRLDPFRNAMWIDDLEGRLNGIGSRAFSSAGNFAFVVGRHGSRVRLVPFQAEQARLNVDLAAVVAASETEAYAVGAAGQLVWYRDTEWEEQPPIAQVDLHGIARTPTGELVAVGDGGTVLTSLDAITWTRAEAGTTSTLRGVWTDATSVIAVGDGGTIVRRDPAGVWTVMRSRTTQDLRAVHGLDVSDVIAVGSNAIVRFDGTEWTGLRTPEPGIELTSVWVTAKHVYVGSTGAGYVLRRAP